MVYSPIESETWYYNLLSMSFYCLLLGLIGLSS